MTNAKALLLAFLLLGGMIVSPISAASYTLTGFQEFNVFDVQKEYLTGVSSISFDKSGEDKAITLIHFKVPQGHTVDFTIYYGTGTTVTGSATNYDELSVWPVQTTTSSIAFDGVTKTYSYFDTNPSWDYYLSGYARNNENNETGLIVYSAGYGSYDNDLAVFKSVSDLPVNLIYRVDLSSDTPFDADISYGTKSEVASSVSKGILEVAGDWVNFAISIAAMVYGVVLTLALWLKFFFIDNLLMTVSLYLAITMAYSFGRAKNMEQGLRKFFRFQRSFFEFILSLWNYLIQILASFRGIFRI